MNTIVVLCNSNVAADFYVCLFGGGGDDEVGAGRVMEMITGRDLL